MPTHNEERMDQTRDVYFSSLMHKPIGQCLRQREIGMEVELENLHFVLFPSKKPFLNE